MIDSEEFCWKSLFHPQSDNRPVSPCLWRTGFTSWGWDPFNLDGLGLHMWQEAARSPRPAGKSAREVLSPSTWDEAFLLRGPSSHTYGTEIVTRPVPHCPYRVNNEKSLLWVWPSINISFWFSQQPHVVGTTSIWHKRKLRLRGKDYFAQCHRAGLQGQDFLTPKACSSSTFLEIRMEGERRVWTDSLFSCIIHCSSG